MHKAFSLTMHDVLLSKTLPFLLNLVIYCFFQKQLECFQNVYDMVGMHGVLYIEPLQEEKTMVIYVMAAQ